MRVLFDKVNAIYEELTQAAYDIAHPPGTETIKLTQALLRAAEIVADVRATMITEKVDE
jgi:hypothetical protein